MKLLKKSFLFANLVLIALTLLSYFSPHIDPNTNSIFSILGLIYPWLFILNFVFILIWILTKSPYAFLSIVTLILGWSHIKSFVGWASANNTNGEDTTIKIVSLNMANSLSLQKKNGTVLEEKIEKFSSYFKSNINADIICTQETSILGNKIIDEQINLPYHHKLSNSSNSIFSKYPIISSGEIDFDLFGTSCAWADIVFDLDTIRFYNLHLYSNLVSKDSEKVLKNADIQNKQMWLGLRGMFAKYKNATAIRAKQTNKILDHIDTCPYPSIICGDLNDTPQSYVYANLSKDRNDSFSSYSKGLGTTYRGVIPALRIDYILPDERLEVIDHKIHKVNYSDHYPISAKIRLP